VEPEITHRQPALGLRQAFAVLFVVIWDADILDGMCVVSIFEDE
jgi:hypothetical protein